MLIGLRRSSVIEWGELSGHWLGPSPWSRPCGGRPVDGQQIELLILGSELTDTLYFGYTAATLASANITPGISVSLPRTGRKRSTATP